MPCGREILRSYNRPSIAVNHVLWEMSKELNIYRSNAGSKIKKLQDLVKELKKASSIVDVEAIALEGRGLVTDYELNQRNWKATMDNIDLDHVVEMLRSAGTGRQRAEDWVGMKGACIRSDYAYYEYNFALKDVEDWFAAELSDREKEIRNQTRTKGGAPMMKQLWDAPCQEQRQWCGYIARDGRET